MPKHSDRAIDVARDVLKEARKMGVEIDLERVLKRFGEFTLITHANSPGKLADSLWREADERKKKRKRAKEHPEDAGIASRSPHDRQVPPGIHPPEWRKLN